MNPRSPSTEDTAYGSYRLASLFPNLTCVGSRPYMEQDGLVHRGSQVRT